MTAPDVGCPVMDRLVDVRGTTRPRSPHPLSESGDSLALVLSRRVDRCTQHLVAAFAQFEFHVLSSG